MLTKSSDVRGNLLNEIHNPMKRGGDRDFLRVFFQTQVWTAILYDPLLPLIRRADRKSALNVAVGKVFIALWD